jgi:hypothetical protein
MTPGISLAALGFLCCFQHAFCAGYGLSHLGGGATPQVVSGWGTFVLEGMEVEKTRG